MGAAVTVDQPRRLSPPLATVAVALVGAALLGWSLYVRTRAFGAGYWIDEGLSVGIAQHGFFHIPAVLKQDGSPPLYYMLLSLWIKAFGSSEEATHALSLLFATLAVPAGLWAGWSLFGRRAGVFTAVVCVGSPFLTAYAQETRMYTLVVLLGILATATFLHAFALRDRRHLPWFAVSLAALLYTHLWSAFFVLAAGVTLLFLIRTTNDRRGLLRDGVIGFGVAFVLWLPWLPTALFHVRHTAAPWAQGPTWRAAQQIPHALIGGWREITITAIVAVIGLAVALRALSRDERGVPTELRVLRAALVFLASMVALAWLISNLSHVWVPRYFAIFLGPLLILTGYAFSRAGVIGLAGLVFLGTFWFYPHEPKETYKSNVKLVVQDASQKMRPGDLVLSTHPEQVPLIWHYMPPGMRYATELGYVPDPKVMDWRDGLDRLRHTGPRHSLLPILDQVPVGSRMLLIRPLVSRRNEWTAPWTSLVRRRSYAWQRIVSRDHRFKKIRTANDSPVVGHRNGGMIGRLYLKTRP